MVLDSLEEGIVMMQEQDIVFQNKLCKHMIESQHSEPLGPDEDYINLKIFRVYESGEEENPSQVSNNTELLSLADIQKFPTEVLKHTLFQTED